MIKIYHNPRCRKSREGLAILAESKKEFVAGELFEVAAEQSHTIKALEDNSVYLCVFSHRDFKGLVTQKYIGNNGAYI